LPAGNIVLSGAHALSTTAAMQPLSPHLRLRQRLRTGLIIILLIKTIT
jgi:hypothetical protein